MTVPASEMPITPVGGLTPLTDMSNAVFEEVKTDDRASLEYAYALLSGTPLPAVDVPEEI